MQPVLDEIARVRRVLGARDEIDEPVVVEIARVHEPEAALARSARGREDARVVGEVDERARRGIVRVRTIEHQVPHAVALRVVSGLRPPRRDDDVRPPVAVEVRGDHGVRQEPVEPVVARHLGEMERRERRRCLANRGRRPRVGRHHRRRRITRDEAKPNRDPQPSSATTNHADIECYLDGQVGVTSRYMPKGGTRCRA